MDHNRTVWLYWEGECPAWIQACRTTIIRHAPQVRVLNPETWDALWLEDRNIDLASLGVEHRSDFIRAYLLAHYGGLWIDSDCVVLRPLDQLLDVLPGIQSLGYQEHYGYLPTAFFGAPCGSTTMAAYYARMRQILLTHESRRWTCAADIVAEVSDRFVGQHILLPLSCVQPVAWNRQAEFYAIRSDADHAERVAPSAVCSMLAYTACKVYERAHPGESLLNDGTFFRYLLKMSDSAARARGR